MFDDINELARDTGWLHAPMVAFARYGVVLFGLLLVVGWWLARDRGPATSRTMAAAIWAGLATVLAVAVNQPLVHGFGEARPYTDHPHLLVLATRSSDFSFPSDHAVMAGAVAAGVWLVDRRLGVVAAVAAAVLGFSRVYIAAHYPHDVLAGFAVGIAVVLLGWLVLSRPLTWLVTRLEHTPLRPLLASPAVRNPEDDATVQGRVRRSRRRKPALLPRPDPGRR